MYLRRNHFFHFGYFLNLSKQYFERSGDKSEKKALASQQLGNNDWKYHFILECLNSGIRALEVNEWLSLLKIDIRVTSACEEPVLQYILYERDGAVSFMLPSYIKLGGFADA